MARTRIDLHLLHWSLWEQSDRHGLIELTQETLGASLGVSRARGGQLIDKLTATGRLEKLSGRSRFQVADPAGFAQSDDGAGDSPGA